MDNEVLVEELGVEELKEKLQKANEDNEALLNENASLKEQLENMAKPVQEVETKNGVGEKFSFEGCDYKVMSTVVRIPKIGRRTALEILADEEAQAWLVKNNSGAIKKMA